MAKPGCRAAVAAGPDTATRQRRAGLVAEVEAGGCSPARLVMRGKATATAEVSSRREWAEPVMDYRTGRERMSRLDSLGRDSTFRWLSGRNQDPEVATLQWRGVGDDKNNTKKN